MKKIPSDYRLHATKSELAATRSWMASCFRRQRIFDMDDAEFAAATHKMFACDPFSSEWPRVVSERLKEISSYPNHRRKPLLELIEAMMVRRAFRDGRRKAGVHWHVYLAIAEKEPGVQDLLMDEYVATGKLLKSGIA